jgi:CubicO group peptidase (beta-lactamase class C family)
LNGGELNGARILSRKSVELMTVDHLGDIEYQPGVGFGRGFSVVKDLGRRGTLGSVGEYGWGGADHSTYWVDPVEQLIVVHMTQVIPAGISTTMRPCGRSSMPRSSTSRREASPPRRPPGGNLGPFRGCYFPAIA